MGKMRTKILLMLFCIVFKRGYAQNSSSIVSRLPEIMEHLCPGTNICRANLTVMQREFETGFSSCCTGCSCRSDCEETGNCCFPAKQQYNTENEDYDVKLQIRRECIYPTTLDLNEYQKMDIQPFYMVTSVSNDRKDKSNISCGDMPVADWGSLFPVYSAKRNQIYKNIACAAADGVTDGKLWKALFSCHEFGLGWRDFTDFVNPTLNSYSLECHINFIYRGKSEEIQRLKCYRDVIDVCPNFGSFQVTEKIGFSKEEIIEACTSGLVSPFRWTKMYANVFCHICNNETFRQSMKCPGMRSTSLLSRPSSFSGLIDAEFFLKDGHAKSLKLKPKVPIACKAKDKESCRQVYCPSGQLYDRFGKCKYTITLWYDQIFSVHLKLTADEDVSIFGVLHLNSSALKTPLPKDWQITGVKYDITNFNKKITRAMVSVASRIPAKRTAYLINTVKQMVQREWKFEVNKTQNILRSGFMSHDWPHYVPDSIRIGNSIENISFPIYTKLYANGRIERKDIIGDENKGPIVINSLYFCKQVELTPSEFILSKNKLVLFHINTHRFIFNQEFTLIQNNESENSSARICIENSGFVEAGQPSISNARNFLAMFCVLFNFIVC